MTTASVACALPWVREEVAGPQTCPCSQRGARAGVRFMAQSRQRAAEGFPSLLGGEWKEGRERARQAMAVGKGEVVSLVNR